MSVIIIQQSANFVGKQNSFMDNNSESHLKKLGQNIARIREKKKMTQYQLAKEIFTDQSNLARIEKGKVNPTVRTLLKISAVLKCKVKDFFDF